MADISRNASQSTVRRSGGDDGARKKKNDDTAKFREYMLTRVERRERRLKLLQCLLIAVAMLLASFVIMTSVFDLW